MKNPVTWRFQNIKSIQNKHSQSFLLLVRGLQMAFCWPQPRTASASDRPWCWGCQCTTVSCSPVAVLFWNLASSWSRMIGCAPELTWNIDDKDLWTRGQIQTWTGCISWSLHCHCWCSHCISWQQSTETACLDQDSFYQTLSLSCQQLFWSPSAQIWYLLYISNETNIIIRENNKMLV